MPRTLTAYMFFSNYEEFDESSIYNVASPYYNKKILQPF